MSYSNIGIIGCSNMGGTLAVCAAKGNSSKGGKLYLADADAQKAAQLAASTFGTAVSNEQIARTCDLIIIAVNPRNLEEMIAGIAPSLRGRRDRFVLATMVAGVTCDRLTELVGRSCPVIRMMPNTPLAVGAGMVQLCRKGVTDAELAEFIQLIQTAGVFDEIDESLIDAASAVSGCGPAFLCLAMEGMADGGVALGLPRDKALKYAAQALAGAGRLALESGAHPGVIKDSVTTPGGATIQGVRELEACGVRSAFMEAVISAFEKTMELKQNT